MGIHLRVRVTSFREPLRNREHGEVCSIAIRNFAPLKRRGNACVWKRTNGISRACGALFRVLDVIEKYSVPFLFPPFRTGESMHAPLACMGQWPRSAAD